MQRARIVSDFPILAGSVSRRLGPDYIVRVQPWTEFLEWDGHEDGEDLLVVDSTTLGDSVAMAMVRSRRLPERVALTSLHTNEVRMFRLEGESLAPEELLSTMLELEV